jgi:hypothetical protein
MTRQNWVGRFDAWIRKTPVWVLLILAAVFVSSVITIGHAVLQARDLYSDTFRWRQEEYRKIGSLAAGISSEKVKETLGSPLFVRKSQDGSLTESSFRGRDYWVQTISDLSGTVRLLAITACNLDFKPEIDSLVGRIVLNESRFDSTNGAPSGIRYGLSGATANSFFYDEYYLGNPGFYKTYLVGIDDACPAVANYAEDLAAQGELPFIIRNLRQADPYSADNQVVAAFRANSVINTYAETDVFTKPDQLLSSFQIGVDRILIRTAP